jgi:predicted transcriptional regulator
MISDTQAAGFAAQPLAEADDTARVTIREKWQGAVTGRSGFVAVPLSLLRLQTKLGLSPTDMIVLINLLAHWWDPDKAVYPRTSTIAARIGVTKRTVQRSTSKMLKLGLIERELADNDAEDRRTFQFHALAQRLASDLNLSLNIAGKESLGT